METKIVNIKTDEYEVYIGRGSLLGNPFSADTVGRLKAIELYHTYYLPAMLEQGKISLSYLKSLKGKTLGCHCKPQPCHGNKLIELIDSL